MTTVAALTRDGTVYMAADTLINVYDRPVPGGARKIRRVRAGHGEALVAGAGHSGILAAIGRLDIETVPGDDDPQRWAESVAVKATRLAVDLSLIDEGTMAASLLLSWSGRLWTLSHATAIPHADGVAAIGSGEQLAIGAIDALLDAGLQIPPTELVVRAVTLAAARDLHSAEPIQLEILPATPG